MRSSTSFKPGNKAQTKKTRGLGKKTLAQQAFTKAGYSPVEAQTALAAQLLKLIESGKATAAQYQLFVKVNTDLLAYESSKAASVIESTSDITSGGEALAETRPLSIVELAQAREQLLRKV